MLTNFFTIEVRPSNRESDVLDAIVTVKDWEWTYKDMDVLRDLARSLGCEKGIAAMVGRMFEEERSGDRLATSAGFSFPTPMPKQMKAA